MNCVVNRLHSILFFGDFPVGCVSPVLGPAIDDIHQWVFDVQVSIYLVRKQFGQSYFQKLITFSYSVVCPQIVSEQQGIPLVQISLIAHMDVHSATAFRLTKIQLTQFTLLSVKATCELVEADITTLPEAGIDHTANKIIGVVDISQGDLDIDNIFSCQTWN